MEAQSTPRQLAPERANRSIAEVLASLESQLAYHRGQEEAHARQEELHRDQRAQHAAERERIEQRLEAFRTAAAEALDLAGRAAPASRDDGEDLGSASRPKLGKMVAKVIEAKGASERFGPVGLSREVNRRFGQRLRKPVDSRQVSVVLRRMHRLGRIHLARQGRPYWEALYVRERPVTEG